MPNITEICDCKETSCKVGCTRTHTHKSYDCGSCKPKLSSITETISLLDELREEAIYEEGYDVYANADKAGYIGTLHNSYEALRQAALDGERYRKALERLVNALDEITKHDCTSHAECDVFHDKEEIYKAAISAYREAIK